MVLLMNGQDLNLHVIQYEGVRTVAVPITECPPLIHFHGIKRDIDHLNVHSTLLQSCVGP